MFKRKVRNSINPSSSNSSTTSNTSSSLNVSNKNINTNQSNMVPREPIFHTDIRTQNTRLVTPRQRQEIYARAHHMFSRILNFLFVQLNLHETDLLFRYLSHHLTWHCLLISVFSPFLFVAIIKLFCTDMKIKTKTI